MVAEFVVCSVYHNVIKAWIYMAADRGRLLRHNHLHVRSRCSQRIVGMGRLDVAKHAVNIVQNCEGRIGQIRSA